MIYLTNKLEFPDYAFAQDGILAVGGDLSRERLKLAYQKGIFPWYSEGQPILWWFPDPRFVLFPKELHVSHSMKKVLKDKIFTFTENRAFKEVITQCQQIDRKGQNGTWITEEVKRAYLDLHEIGWAKSIEVWRKGELVGGLYGIQRANIFFGESMFSKVSNASKAGFIQFVLKNQDTWKLIDCQVYTAHLAGLGARMIPAKTFLTYL